MELEQVDTELELKKHAASVHTKLPGITADYIYAKIDNDEKKQAIIDIIDHAYYIQRLINNLAKKIRNHEWKNNQWTKTNINEQQLQKLKKIQAKLAESYLTKTHMYTILHRNKANNHILGHMKQEQQNPEETEDKNWTTQLKEFITQNKQTQQQP